MFVWSSPVLNYLDPDYCPNYHCDLTLTKQEAVWVNAIAFFGCIFSVPMAGWFMSKIGIKWTMILLGLPLSLALLLLTFAKNTAMLLTGRFLYGLSSGAFGLLVPSYTSETAEPRIKGAMGSLLNVVMVLGNLFIAILGKYLEWRVMTGILLFIPVLMAVWMVNMPESPVQLVKRGKISQAERSLVFLRGPRFNVKSELQDIQTQVKESQQEDSVSMKLLVTRREYLLPTLISMTLMFLQQFSGIAVVLSYAVQLFKDAGLGDTMDGFTCNILVCVTNIVFGVVSLLLVDRSSKIFLQQ